MKHHYKSEIESLCINMPIDYKPQPPSIGNGEILFFVILIYEAKEENAFVYI